MLIKQKILFTELECKKILHLPKTNLQTWDFSDRLYCSERVSYKEETKWLFEKLKYFFESETGLKVRKLKEELHFHTYKEGSRFNIHNDVREQRVYAVGTLLNSDFNGGDFMLYGLDTVVLEKKAGNSYVFDVKIDHEIKVVEKGTRHSLLWFLQKDNIEFKTNKLI